MDRRELLRLTGAAAAGAVGAFGVASALRSYRRRGQVADKAPPSACEVYQGSASGLDMWSADRRDRDYRAEPARAIGESSSNPKLVERLLASYRRTFKKEHYGGLWLPIFERNHLALHRVFMEGNAHEAERILADPASSELHMGFDTTVADLTKRLMASEAASRAYAKTCKMKLLTLGDALGATRLDNPESYCATPQPAPAPQTDALLEDIERSLGLKIDFPNPFPNEFGLATKRGIAGYRAINALYQAQRIKNLLAGVRNPRILEIGGGTGRTAYYAHKLGLGNYTIVDLPFTAITQGYFLGRALGADAVAADGESARADAIKLQAPETFFASRQRYDLIVNVDSLTELGLETATAYWKAIQRRATQFLSINHEANEFTVRQLPGAAPRTRQPYWMRRGYVEELFFFSSST